jgi:hypothetical protein
MNIKNIILGIIIGFVFLLFCVYGTKLIYKEPTFENYCNTSYYSGYYPPEKTGIITANCSYPTILNLKTQNCSVQKGNPEPIYDDKGCQTDVYCNLCSLDYQAVDKIYSKNLFIIAIVFSLIVIIIALFAIAVESVSGGLMFGSLMFLVYGTGRYWQFMDDWLRFIILGIALVILIYVGYRFANKNR